MPYVRDSLMKGNAQSCGNDSLYRLPYKDTYVKSPLVAENTYRIAKPNYTSLPKSMDEAQNIFRLPIWEGHEEELRMYWRAWEIAIGNIRNPQPNSGFVSPYIDTAYNGNLFNAALFFYLDVCPLWSKFLFLPAYFG